MADLLHGFSTISRDEWQNKIEKELKGKKPETLNWDITDNITLKPFYLKEDITFSENSIKTTISYQRQICENIQAASPESANKKALSALMQGANAINFDCRNCEINKTFFNSLLNQIELKYIHSHFITNDGINFIKHFTEWCSSNNIDKHQLQGSFCFDIFHHQLVSGINIDEEEFVSFAKNALLQFPKMNMLTINACSYTNAGANIIQELAYTLAHVNEYLHLLEKHEQLTVLKQIKINVSLSSSYLIQIAKLRSLRVLLQSLIEKYNLKETTIDIHAFTATFNKSHKDAYNNMLRATTEIMSGIIGTANILTALPYDELTGNSNEFSSRISRNISLILSEESYLDKVIDPSSGAYYIEKLTQELTEKSWDKFCRIEENGGWKKMLQNGEMIKEIETEAEKLIKEYAENKKVLIGVNKYPNKNDKELSIENTFPVSVSEINTLNELMISKIV
jgi:methylmalonyl-CoA mutase